MLILIIESICLPRLKKMYNRYIPAMISSLWGHLMLVVMNQQEIHPLLPFQYKNEAGELSLRCEVNRRAGFIDEEYNTYHTKELSSK